MSLATTRNILSSETCQLEDIIRNIEKYASVPTPKRSEAKRSESPLSVVTGEAKPIPQSMATPHPAPDRRKYVYNVIKAMRFTIAAPVNSMGCDNTQPK
ncbi:hypothetical protein IW262DRAFT_553083 [Armillaria fumosa]|nr:hypothetical protein IW262DRAFT_553083 [Armillaria fumosa]